MPNSGQIYGDPRPSVVALRLSEARQPTYWDRGRAGSPTDVFLSVGVLGPPAFNKRRAQRVQSNFLASLPGILSSTKAKYARFQRTGRRTKVRFKPNGRRKSFTSLELNNLILASPF